MTKEEIKNKLEPFVIDGTLFNYYSILKNAFYKESFKFLFKVFNKNNYYINDIKEQLMDANRSFEKRKIKKGYRITKGLMEDIIEFIVLDFNPNFEVAIGDRPKKYRDYLFANILKDDQNELQKEYKILYEHVAKIDHTSSLKIYIRDLEKNNAYNGIEKTCSDITSILILILIEYAVSKNPDKYNLENEFIVSLWIVLRYFTMIVSSYLLINDEKTMNDDLYFKSYEDKKYLEFQKDFINESVKELSESEFNNPEILNEIIAFVDKELNLRGYDTNIKKMEVAN